MRLWGESVVTILIQIMIQHHHHHHNYIISLSQKNMSAHSSYLIFIEDGDLNLLTASKISLISRKSRTNYEFGNFFVLKCWDQKKSNLLTLIWWLRIGQCKLRLSGVRRYFTWIFQPLSCFPRDLCCLVSRDQNCVKPDRPRRRNLRPVEGPGSTGESGLTLGRHWARTQHVIQQGSVKCDLICLQNILSLSPDPHWGGRPPLPLCWGSWKRRRGRGRPSFRYLLKSRLSWAVITNVCLGGRRREKGWRRWSQRERSEDQFRIKVGQDRSALDSQYEEHIFRSNNLWRIIETYLYIFY